MKLRRSFLKLRIGIYEIKEIVKNDNVKEKNKNEEIKNMEKNKERKVK